MRSYLWNISCNKDNKYSALKGTELMRYISYEEFAEEMLEPVNFEQGILLHKQNRLSF